jgi:hypothetical protein
MGRENEKRKKKFFRYISVRLGDQQRQLENQKGWGGEKFGWRGGGGGFELGQKKWGKTIEFFLSEYCTTLARGVS